MDTLPLELLVDILLRVPSGALASIGVGRLSMPVPPLPTLRLVCKEFCRIIDGEMEWKHRQRRWVSEQVAYTATRYGHDVTRRLPLISICYLVEQFGEWSGVEPVYAPQPFPAVCVTYYDSFSDKVLLVRAREICRTGRVPGPGESEGSLDLLSLDALHSAHPEWTRVLRLVRCTDCSELAQTCHLLTLRQVQALVVAIAYAPLSNTALCFPFYQRFYGIYRLRAKVDCMTYLFEMFSMLAQVDITGAQRNEVITWAVELWNSAIPEDLDQHRKQLLIQVPSVLKLYGVSMPRTVPWV